MRLPATAHVLLCAIALCACNALDGGDDQSGHEPELTASGPQAGAVAPCANPATETPEVPSAVDLLFVVDDGPEMAGAQAALAAELPRLIAALGAGDVDADGVMDAPRVRDLHVGVISTDLGTTEAGMAGCVGHGDDGVLRETPGVIVDDCDPSYPSFLTFDPDLDDAERVAGDLACLTTLGTEGCRFGQPLEASLKALWPSVDRDPTTGEVFEPNRILFLSEAEGQDALGHGDGDNLGFLRNLRSDPSLIAIVYLTDEDDCSSASTEHFRPNEQLAEDDPLRRQDPGLRCFFNPQNLYALDRYVNGLQALRPGRPWLVRIAAFVGVAPDLVDDDARERVNFRDPAARDAYYEALLANPRMLEQPVPNAGAGEGELVPACDGPIATAPPARRVVEVVRRFGDAGRLGSICDFDLDPVMELVLEGLTPRSEMRGCEPVTTRAGAR